MTFIASISIYQTDCVTPKKSLEISVSLFTTSGRIVETQALIDSGAGEMFIDEDFAKRHRLPLKRLDKLMSVYNVNRTPNKGGIIHKQVTIRVEIDRQSKDLVLLATALGKQCIILGYTWLEEENLDIDWRKNTLTWHTEPHQNIYMMIQPVENEETNDQNLVISFIKAEMNPQVTEDWISSWMFHSQLFTEKDKKEEKPVKEIVLKEFHKYLKTVFAEREIGCLLKRTTYNHAIDLIPNLVPKKGTQYCTSPKEDAKMEKFIKENKAKGFIQKLTSLQAAVTHIVQFHKR